MSNLIKVLSIGNVNGHLDVLAEKLPKLVKQAGIDLILVAGNLFGKQDDASTSAHVQRLLDGDIKFPVPLYFIAGDLPLPQAVVDAIIANGSLSPEHPVPIGGNAFYLGPSGIYTLPNKLTLAFVSGAWKPAQYLAPPRAATPHLYTSRQLTDLQTAAETVLAGGHQCDILLTFTAPAGMHAADRVPMKHESPVLRDVVRALRPRYHLTGGPGAFYERAPFAHAPIAPEEGTTGVDVTRFLAIGPVPVAGKPAQAGKWVFAFRIVPTACKAATDLEKAPKGCTATPLGGASSVAPGNGAVKRQRGEESEDGAWGAAATGAGADAAAAVAASASDQAPAAKRARADGTMPRPPPATYVCRRCNVPGHWIQDCPESQKCSVCASTEHPARECPVRVCRACNTEGHDARTCPQVLARRAEGAPAPCWFCLGSASADTALVVAAGKNVYAAVAKGELTNGHLILAAQQHVQHLHRVQPDNGGGEDVYVATHREMNAFLAAIRHAYLTWLPTVIKEVEQKEPLVTCMYQICRALEPAHPQQHHRDGATTPPAAGTPAANGNHGHLQVVPVTKAQAEQSAKDLVERLTLQCRLHPMTYTIPTEHATSLVSAYGYLRTTDPDTASTILPAANHVAMLAGEHLVFCEIPARSRFPMSLPREVVGLVLGTGDRARDWRLDLDSDRESAHAEALAQQLRALHTVPVVGSAASEVTIKNEEEADQEAEVWVERDEEAPSSGGFVGSAAQ
ncbi:hypothetical protein BC828DRAFT_385946 [Blastocladiella britannica]|nr:hypothetical protein BC828DRAFT_385946 [Blastocladiella britannica]